MTNPIDPFAGGESAPAFTFPEVGTTHEGTILEPPALVQGKDFNTGDPAYWPAKPGQEPNPVMCAVLKIEQADGEVRSLWATKPSAMFVALKEAQRIAGKPFEVGGTIAIRFAGEEAHTDPDKIRRKLPAKKLYSAKYQPPAPVDAFADASKGSDDPPW